MIGVIDDGYKTHRPFNFIRWMSLNSKRWWPRRWSQLRKKDKMLAEGSSISSIGSSVTQ
jgi:hypothetical protein